LTFECRCAIIPIYIFYGDISMSIRNYDEDVEYNLNNCFDKSGKFVKSEKYKDPDYSTYHSIVVVPKILISKNGEKMRR